MHIETVPTPDALLGPTEVARLLGVSADTLRGWRARGDRGPAFYKVGGVVRYHREDVAAFMASVRRDGQPGVA